MLDVGSQRVGSRRPGASAVVIRVVCWNVARKVQMVAELLDMDADVAFLLDAGRAILEALDNSALSEACRDRMKFLRK